MELVKEDKFQDLVIDYLKNHGVNSNLIKHPTFKNKTLKKLRFYGELAYQEIDGQIVLYDNLSFKLKGDITRVENEIPYLILSGDDFVIIREIIRDGNTLYLSYKLHKLMPDNNLLISQNTTSLGKVLRDDGKYYYVILDSKTKAITYDAAGIGMKSSYIEYDIKQEMFLKDTIGKCLAYQKLEEISKMYLERYDNLVRDEYKRYIRKTRLTFDSYYVVMEDKETSSLFKGVLKALSTNLKDMDVEMEYEGFQVFEKENLEIIIPKKTSDEIEKILNKSHLSKEQKEVLRSLNNNQEYDSNITRPTLIVDGLEIMNKHL